MRSRRALWLLLSGLVAGLVVAGLLLDWDLRAWNAPWWILLLLGGLFLSANVVFTPSRDSAPSRVRSRRPGRSSLRLRMPPTSRLRRPSNRQSFTAPEAEPAESSLSRFLWSLFWLALGALLSVPIGIFVNSIS
ncbi:hypothetical protein [Asanoa siamensis]|uniref:DUF4175 domain-containing protein n=1 Tax=Asanoa siamensis TaxID=926357 RepID=A0ABQ4CVY0_9ACTN|nr:hypothetical protein [Asanoa siamensis]GIF75435.1 hypothetical protein Asi02nite_49530 [Asanoa siamensis]